MVVGSAIERSKLPQGTDANLVLETLVGPLYVRLLLTGEPLDEDVADRVAALVARGAERAPRLA